MKKVVVLAFLSLTGCMGDQATTTTAQTKASPSELRAMIVAKKSEFWKDPDSIRGAKIGKLALCQGWTAGDCACLSLNAKNSFGGYGGEKQYAVIYTGQSVANVRERFPSESCSEMEDFAELNGVTLAVAGPASLPSQSSKPYTRRP